MDINALVEAACNTNDLSRVIVTNIPDRGSDGATMRFIDEILYALRRAPNISRVKQARLIAHLRAYVHSCRKYIQINEKTIDALNNYCACAVDSDFKQCTCGIPVRDSIALFNNTERVDTLASTPAYNLFALSPGLVHTASPDTIQQMLRDITALDFKRYHEWLQTIDFATADALHAAGARFCTRTLLVVKLQQKIDAICAVVGQPLSDRVLTEYIIDQIPVGALLDWDIEEVRKMSNNIAVKFRTNYKFTGPHSLFNALIEFPLAIFTWQITIKESKIIECSFSFTGVTVNDMRAKNSRSGGFREQHKSSSSDSDSD